MQTVLDSTWLSMDVRGRPLWQQDAHGAVSIWTRNTTTTWVSAFTDANNHTTTYTRDDQGYVIVYAGSSSRSRMTVSGSSAMSSAVGVMVIVVTDCPAPMVSSLKGGCLMSPW